LILLARNLFFIELSRDLYRGPSSVFLWLLIYKQFAIQKECRRKCENLCKYNFHVNSSDNSNTAFWVLKVFHCNKQRISVNLAKKTAIGIFHKKNQIKKLKYFTTAFLVVHRHIIHYIMLHSMLYNYGYIE